MHDDNSALVMGIFASIAITLVMSISLLYFLESEAAEAAETDVREAGIINDELESVLEDFTGPDAPLGVFREALATKEEIQRLQLEKIWKDRLRNDAWLPKMINGVRALVDHGNGSSSILRQYEELTAPDDDRRTPAGTVFPRSAKAGVARSVVQEEIVKVCRTAESRGVLGKKHNDAVEDTSDNTGVLLDRRMLKDAIHAAFEPARSRKLSAEEATEQRFRVQVGKIHANNLRILASTILHDLLNVRASFIEIEKAVATIVLSDQIRSEPEGTSGDGREKVVERLSEELLLLNETEDYLRGER